MERCPWVLTTRLVVKSLNMVIYTHIHDIIHHPLSSYYHAPMFWKISWNWNLWVMTSQRPRSKTACWIACCSRRNSLVIIRRYGHSSYVGQRLLGCMMLGTANWTWAVERWYNGFTSLFLAGQPIKSELSESFQLSPCLQPQELLTPRNLRCSSVLWLGGGEISRRALSFGYLDTWPRPVVASVGEREVKTWRLAELKLYQLLMKECNASKETWRMWKLNVNNWDAKCVFFALWLKIALRESMWCFYRFFVVFVDTSNILRWFEEKQWDTNVLDFLSPIGTQDGLHTVDIDILEGVKHENSRL